MYNIITSSGQYNDYASKINSRSFLHYILGLAIRWKQSLKYRWACKIARKRGAEIGIGVIMPISLAKEANSNLHIRNHVSI